MLQFITHTNNRFDHLAGAIEALKGGCKWIQLRMKESTTSEIVQVGIELRKVCQECGATLIIDDHVELIERIGADGVHLGKSDMSPTEARKILGAKAIIGGTANTLDDIVRLHSEGVDYIGLGPFRYTTTKQNLSPLLGLDGMGNVVRAAHEQGVSIPIVAIGGIVREDIAQIIAAGVTGIALSGTILAADSPMAETEAVLCEIERSR